MLLSYNRGVSARSFPLLSGALVAALASGCLDLGAPQPGRAPSSAPQATPAPNYTVAYRVGDLWDRFDGRLEIYDRRRWFWLDVRDSSGKTPLEAPRVAVVAPPGLTPPQVYEIQKEQGSDRYFLRVRFYDPGPGYRMAVQTKGARGEAEMAEFDLPEVLPAARQAGAISLAYTASPSLGRPFVPAVVTVRASDPAGKAATLDQAPKVRVVNPCGWGPSGAFEPVPGEAGAYSYQVPQDEMIDVTGNYKIKVYPVSDQASYVEYTYETR